MSHAHRPLFFISVSVFLFAACHSGAPGGAGFAVPTPELPVFSASQHPFSSHQEFQASVEGSKDIEIRPQVNGYLDRIYVDEGAPVSKGQTLFLVNDRPYREALNNAKAALAAAKANQATAKINVDKLTPLVEHNVVSPVQLSTAKAAYDASTASVDQAQAMVANAEINIGYTRIKAPVNGFIGRIPFKQGSLVGMSTVEPLTMLSEARDVRAYFSFSENDLIHFRTQYRGKTDAERIRHMPPVQLVLANDSLYPEKGKVEMLSGQFSAGTGSVSLRASFPNAGGGLKSGNTGRIRIPSGVPSGIVIPQESTFELQEKIFVFLLGDSNKVSSVAVNVADRSGNYYLIRDGIKAGDKIVYSGVDRLRDGAVIKPEPMSFDSLLKARPM